MLRIWRRSTQKRVRRRENNGKKKRASHLITNDPQREETLGQLISENREKDIPGMVGVLELVREANRDYESNLEKSILRGKEAFSGDFFVVVLFKNERLFDEVHRSLFFPRKSCPTPTYCQTVYKYHRDLEAIEFLWVIPDKDTCHFYQYYALEVDEEERELLGYIMSFYAGELDAMSKRLNNEQPGMPSLILVPEEKAAIATS